MRRIAAVSVDDDLTAGQAAVSVRAADDEIARRVDQEVARLAGHPAFRQASSTASLIISLTMPGAYFLPLRVCALCCVETTTLVQPTG